MLFIGCRLSATAIGILGASVLMLNAAGAHAQAFGGIDRVGEVSEIIRDVQSSGPGSRSVDRGTLRERVIGVRDDGLELEYDLPEQATSVDRERNWQYPVRVFKPVRGSMQLLNGSELELRVDAWLKKAKLDHTACGHWYFTWNAFKVECDPQSAVTAVEAFDLRLSDIRDGAL